MHDRDFYTSTWASARAWRTNDNHTEDPPATLLHVRARVGAGTVDAGQQCGNGEVRQASVERLPTLYLHHRSFPSCACLPVRATLASHVGRQAMAFFGATIRTRRVASSSWLTSWEHGVSSRRFLGATVGKSGLQWLAGWLAGCSGAPLPHKMQHLPPWPLSPSNRSIALNRYLPTPTATAVGARRRSETPTATLKRAAAAPTAPLITPLLSPSEGPAPVHPPASRQASRNPRTLELLVIYRMRPRLFTT